VINGLSGCREDSVADVGADRWVDNATESAPMEIIASRLDGVEPSGRDCGGMTPVRAFPASCFVADTANRRMAV